MKDEEPSVVQEAWSSLGLVLGVILLGFFLFGLFIEVLKFFGIKF